MEEDKQTHEGKRSSSVAEEEPIRREDPETEKPTEASPENTGGWGWGFSVLSDLQKAAEDLSRNVMFPLPFDQPLMYSRNAVEISDPSVTVTNDIDFSVLSFTGTLHCV